MSNVAPDAASASATVVEDERRHRVGRRRGWMSRHVDLASSRRDALADDAVDAAASSSENEDNVVVGAFRATGGYASLGRGSQRLRRLLVGLDAGAIVASWLPVDIGGRSGLDRAEIDAGAVLLVALLTSTVLSVWFASARRLYRARVCSVKAHERSLLISVAVVSAVAGWVVIRLLGGRPHDWLLAADALLAYGLLVAERSGYRAWLAEKRAQGRFVRPTVVVGTNDEALSWCRLFKDHPEFGTVVVGLVGEHRNGLESAGVPWLGPSEEVVALTRGQGAASVLVVGTAFQVQTLKRLTRELSKAHIHLQVSMGLMGLAQGRLTTTEISREVVLYVEPRTLSRRALVAKRVFDVVIASVALVGFAPAFVVAGLLIRRHDGGPVLFTQKRVGRDGEEFTFYKLRTMVPDAESRRSEIAADNVRQGPLFKLLDDPRVTPVGRFLRLSSMDEMPQLYNVLRGDMSLVGPRPALPEEVAHFDEELLARHDVRPGITGLWQLEARDGSSFESYQRLDLHYVENWSLTLDAAILVSTVASVFARIFRRMRTTLS